MLTHMALKAYAPINVKPAGGRWGIGWDFDICQKIAIKFPTPGKNVRSNRTEFLTRGNDLWSQARTTIQISLSPGQQDNSNALPPGQNDRSKFRPMPRLPPTPRRLDIDRCITPVLQVLSWVHVKKIKQQKSCLLSKSNRKILV